MMMLGSMNVKRVRVGIKKKKVKSLIEANKIQFMAIQETKMELIESSLCEYLWGSSSFRWIYNTLIGRSGGMLCLLDSQVFKMCFWFSSCGYIGVSGTWGHLNLNCFLVNIYAPSNFVARRRIWDELTMSRRGFGGGIGA